MTLFQKLKTLIIGKARDPSDKALFHNLSLIAFFAWVGLGADGLSSSSYGPQEAFLALQGHTYLAIFVALGTALTIFVIGASYSQTIEAFPSGGGGYAVASKLLSPTVGMISGSALIIDYVLTIALSVASGADAIFSFLPLAWGQYKLWFALGGVLLLIMMNLRGVKESIIPLVPIFLVFVLTHVFAVVYTVLTHLLGVSDVVSSTVTDIRLANAELGFVGVILLILRAYSMGAGTYTGIEAVSNGLPILREPRVETAKRTMRYMTFSLAFMVVGLMTCYLLFKVQLVPGKTLNAVLFEQMTASWGGNTGYIFVLVTLFSEAAILFVAAQAGLLAGPRVIANMALDHWFPTRFAMLSDRLVTQNGILLMGGAAFITVLLSHGSVKLLVVLYSINVFITFVLSQLGMVRYWWNERQVVIKWKKKILVNGLGLVLCLFILLSVTILKFNEGGWITLLVTGTIMGIVVIVRRHYEYTGRQLKRLDTLIAAVSSPDTEAVPGVTGPVKALCEFDPKSKTAILLVNGFNGLGLHTLFGIFRLFGGVFKNFVFIQVGIVDAGVYKGSAEFDNLQKHIQAELDRYVGFMQRQGHYAESIPLLGVDVVDEVTQAAPQILQRFPESIFFGGQLVFPQESYLSRWLHNYTVFAIQRKFYYQGIPVVLLPIRL